MVFVAVVNTDNAEFLVYSVFEVVTNRDAALLVYVILQFDGLRVNLSDGTFIENDATLLLYNPPIIELPPSPIQYFTNRSQIVEIPVSLVLPCEVLLLLLERGLLLLA